MKTIRRLIYGEILQAIGFVLLAFLVLFSFFELIDQLNELGRASPLNPALRWGFFQSLSYIALLLPSRLYELMPIGVLIGSIVVLTRMAQSSEFTILRTSGLGPQKALRTLAVLGLGLAAFTFVLGDYVVPLADRAAQSLRIGFFGGGASGQSGAWLRDKQANGQYSVNVSSVGPDGGLSGVRIFQLNNQGQLVSVIQAQSGQVQEAGDRWRLQQVSVWQFPPVPRETAQFDPSPMQMTQHDQWHWPTQIGKEIVTAALLRPERMSTWDLFSYVRHLSSNGQVAQRYEIEFWRKLVYPLSCMVMLVLALPFAYLHFRAKGIVGYVFAGVMIGISFFLLNSIFSHMGTLNQWRPWLAAIVPSVLYTMVSLSAFVYLVIKQ